MMAILIQLNFSMANFKIIDFKSIKISKIEYLHDQLKISLKMVMNYYSMEKFLQIKNN